MTSSTPFCPEYDAIIVGARAAGAATAMLLARAGLRVLAVDRDREGSDTLSTHALMRAGVLQLRRWGLLGALEAAGTPAIRTATFHYGAESVAVPVKPRDGVDALYAPRRTLLDPLLVGAAREAGAHVVHEATLVDLVRGQGGRIEGAVLAARDGTMSRVGARLVIGADGLRSRVARLTGAPVERTGRHASAVVYGHWSGLAVDGYHWHYRPQVSAGAIPTDAGRTCLFVAIPSQRFRADLPRGIDAIYRTALAAAAPELAEASRGGCLDGKLRPFPGTPGFLRRPWGQGWALVGDAGYFKDPATAHGITDALRDAELLARAVIRGTETALAEYHAARDGAALGLFEVTDAIASFAWTLEEAKVQHQALARHMVRETELLLALDAVAPGSGGRSTPPVPSRTRRRVEMQGFTGLDDARLAEIAPWLRLAPAICMLWTAVATVLGSAAVAAALVPFAAAGALGRGHPFDLAYQRGLRRLLGAPPIPPYAAPRRFAWALATLWLLGMAAALHAGSATLGRALGAGLVATAAVNVVTGFCVPSWIYARLFALRSGRPVCGASPSP